MDLKSKYQPGMRHNSFYELQDPKDCLTEADRKMLSHGIDEPREETWIGIGELKMRKSKEKT